LIVGLLVGAFGSAGPHAMMAVLFLLTSGLGLFLSNTAIAVLIAPVAIQAARTLEVSPYPFAVMVLIAASAAFITPFSTPVVTLVVQPGRYNFGHFAKVGSILWLLTFLTAMLLTPIFFPL